MRPLWLIPLIVLAGVAPAAGALRGPPAVSQAAAAGARPGRSSAIIYASDWTGPSELFAVDPSTKATLGQLTHGREPDCHDVAYFRRSLIPCGFTDPLPSPDGRWLLFRATETDLGGEGSFWLAAADGGGPRELPIDFGRAAAWSPDSKAFAYYVQCFCDQGGLHIVQVRNAGSSDRLVFPDHRQGLDAIVWSRRGIAFRSEGGLMLYRNGKATALGPPPIDPEVLSWSPSGQLLVSYQANLLSNPPSTELVISDPRGRVKLDVGQVVDRDVARPALGRVVAEWSMARLSSPHGIGLVDLRSYRARQLTSDRGFGLAWSPDSSALAYIHGVLGIPVPFFDTYDLQAQTSDLRSVSLSGRVRTIVSADRSYGGRIVALAWARRPARASYRPPDPTPRERVVADGLLAPGTIEALAADGSRVAYAACQHVYLWTPAAGTLASVPASARFPVIDPTDPTDPSCRFEYPFWFNGLALARGRVAWGWLKPSGNDWACDVYAAELAPLTPPAFLADGCGTTYTDWLAKGDVVGAGDFLGFSEWHEDCAARPCDSVVTTAQTIDRIDGLACPCPAIASSPGPLIAFDVQDGRIVSGGTNATVILDSHGNQLLSIRVSPLAAQLSGNQLVVLVHGALRDYDTSSGTLLHSWPLPDVSSGAHFVGPLRSDPVRLTLEDAASGLVAYVVDDQLHLLRLADGADKLIGDASLARFMDTGLVYADGARLRLVPFDQLPLR